MELLMDALYDSCPASSTGGVSGDTGVCSNTISSSRAWTMTGAPDHPAPGRGSAGREAPVEGVQGRRDRHRPRPRGRDRVRAHAGVARHAPGRARGTGDLAKSLE